MYFLQLIMLKTLVIYLIVKNIVGGTGFLMSTYPVYQNVTENISLVFAYFHDIN